MNERIRELAEQADGVFIHKLMTGAKQYTFLEKDLEKFAELIVKECVQVCEPTLDEPYEDMTEFGKGLVEGQDIAIERIKKHFGVE